VKSRAEKTTWIYISVGVASRLASKVGPTFDMQISSCLKSFPYLFGDNLKRTVRCIFP
jgi:hypothetical protein